MDWSQLPRRVGTMVRWLLENCQRVAAMQKGRLTFSFAGNAISVEINEIVQVD